MASTVYIYIYFTFIQGQRFKNNDRSRWVISYASPEGPTLNPLRYEISQSCWSEGYKLMVYVSRPIWPTCCLFPYCKTGKSNINNTRGLRHHQWTIVPISIVNEPTHIHADKQIFHFSQVLKNVSEKMFTNFVENILKSEQNI